MFSIVGFIWPRENAKRFTPSLEFVSGIILLPTLVAALICYGGFIGWTAIISFTDSHLMPTNRFVGWHEYARLLNSPRWWSSAENLVLFSLLLIIGCISIGYFLAILIDKGTRWEAFYRTIFMLPLSISYIVSGVIWLWVLNPDLGIQHAVRDLGWTGFTFDWLVRSDRAIFVLAAVGIWQQSGLCMALFLAALRSIDPNIWKAARVDCVSPLQKYFYVITPMLRPAFAASFVLLFATAVKSYEIVVVLTGGGPGFSSDLPAHVVVQLLNRQELGMAAAGATLLLCTIVAVTGPFVYLLMRRRQP